MIRHSIEPRKNWQHVVEAQGLIWHTADGKPYWDESVYYSFTADQVDTIECATATLYGLFIEAGQHVIEHPLLMKAFGIPEFCHGAIRDAWNNEPPALNFGRFDLGYDGVGEPKLFEFNCDTPTSLLEAAVIQWSWKEERFPHLDQFNSLHERLVAKWRGIAPHLPATFHFAHTADAAGEDTVTTSYLRDTALEAGIETTPIVIDDIGWNARTRRFVDLDEQPIDGLFKLYPWEWLVREEFGQSLIESLPSTLWLEPIWKMIWSNKAILATLWDLFPGHPNLLGASVTAPERMRDAVAKPFLAREGANVSIRRDGAVAAETGGGYGAEGYLYQELFPLPEMAPGAFPVIGSWVVDGEAAGMGIREDGLITGNTARFVPHVIEQEAARG